ncbi:arylamine N-acetyltransferase family protein [Paraburkholderia sp. 22099]|jgi:N-hydroxyarylamine O-acetyltransferase|uniref:N-hydroxyarylamine O-acetyltransferase n=1 Tax=Paraburkholderia terricola TaxID=169427 RepID=A0A1M6WHX2_9BURK|nr:MULTISPECIES: arylamine N-acetyltransferase [Paraburkholderia]ORC45947.1 N-hydroxyarylamine O-acetyltransferase [Burkholderia sp. A27]AXE94528.1 arylamine N-acetyltransferase [Paraburkholderia terricola]MDR6448496.1 N-hydroxyarylamine O-acetyltransferase [Paraburkholderia terricola]MDR6494223.1 N-hydroxyarylamine O-acetyltransferase [Paraburkholderia terricola]SDP18745.1 N-hydroxyarylamine O-acetyltransferase [Paraburkholderia sediminicola]
MSDTVNLENYFARIGYRGPRAATLEVLRDIHTLHPRAIPFENLNPLTRRAVKLDLASIENKLVTERRGGYCFEQNALLANVLTQLGFKVTPLLGRVLWGREPGVIPPRTHMVLRIDIGNEAWIADVGFGSVTLTAPLRLNAGLAQPTPLGTFRLADAAHGSLYLEVLTRDESWSRVYRFDLQPVEWIDYETSNWYTSTAPDSIFASNLIVCRVLPEARLTLLNDLLNERAPDGQIVSERQLASADELAACLRDRFGLNTGGIDIGEIFGRVRTPANSA